MTRTWSNFWMILSFAFAPIAQAQVNALPSMPHLLVKGESTRDVVPDRFTISVTLTALDMRPAVARERVQHSLSGLLTALKGSDVVPNSINATVFSVAPAYEYVERERIFKGTRVTRQLRVTFPGADETREFLAQLQGSEDVVLGGIEPVFSGETQLRGELKAEAMRQTRQTAELLAHSYGARIKGLYSVSDVAPNFAYGIQAGTWRSIRTPPAPGAPPVVFDAPSPVDTVTVTGTRITPESIAVGTITIAENLYAVFLLAD